MSNGQAGHKCNVQEVPVLPHVSAAPAECAAWNQCLQPPSPRGARTASLQELQFKIRTRPAEGRDLRFGRSTSKRLHPQDVPAAPPKEHQLRACSKQSPGSFGSNTPLSPYSPNSSRAPSKETQLRAPSKTTALHSVAVPPWRETSGNSSEVSVHASFLSIGGGSPVGPRAAQSLPVYVSTAPVKVPQLVTDIDITETMAWDETDSAEEKEQPLRPASYARTTSRVGQLGAMWPIMAPCLLMLGFLIGIFWEQHLQGRRAVRYRADPTAAAAAGTRVSAVPIPVAVPEPMNLEHSHQEHVNSTRQNIGVLAADGACGASGDKAFWFETGRAHFQEAIGKCGVSCWGNSGCVSDCIMKNEGYSGTCAVCFGDLAGCTTQRCFFQCAGGRGANCDACSEQNCFPVFTRCSGFIPPSGVAQDRKEEELPPKGVRALRAEKHKSPPRHNRNSEFTQAATGWAGHTPKGFAS